MKFFLKLSNPELDDDFLAKLRVTIEIMALAREKAHKLPKSKTRRPVEKSKNITDLIRPLEVFKYEEGKPRLERNIKVLFVRNPLERLLSAWKDRLVNLADKSYKGVNKNIIHKYRNEDSDNNSTTPTLLEFFSYLKDQRLPKTMDYHWRPAYHVCHVCAMEYDFIGHVESIDKDSERLLEMINPLVRIPVRKMRDPIPIAKDERYIELYETVPRQLTEDVLQIYWKDYELFGYNLTKDIEVVYGKM